MADWWTYPVTQGYNPPTEFGIDVGTPFHTAITDLLGGTVKATGYHPWGGEVDIATKSGLTEYVLHLDQIAPGLNPGTAVKAGQVIGLSGGQLAGGQHPVSSRYSTGPHVEYGLYSGSFGSKTVDPTALVKAGYKGSAATDSIQASPTSPHGPSLQDIPFPGLDLAFWLGKHVPGPLGTIYEQVAGTPVPSPLSDPLGLQAAVTSLGHGLADFFVVSEQDIAEWLKRQTVAFFVAAIVLLVLFA